MLTSDYVDYLFNIYCYVMQDNLIYEDNIGNFYKWLKEYRRDIDSYASFLVSKLAKDKVYLEVGNGPINSVSKVLRENKLYTFVISKYLELFKDERLGFCGDIGISGGSPVIINGNDIKSFSKMSEDLVFMATLDSDFSSVGTIMNLDPTKYSILLGVFGKTKDNGMEYYLGEMDDIKKYLISWGYKKDYIDEYKYNDNLIYRRVLIANKKK